MLTRLDPDYLANELAGVAGESRRLEFKAGFSWEINSRKMGWIQACTIRAILGLTNTRYGGTIVIGIKDDGHSNFNYLGIDNAMTQSFNEYEQIQQQIDSFADGPLNYEMGVAEYDSKDFIVVTVSEFEDFPVLCAKDDPVQRNKPVLVKDDLYVRSKRAKPSTIRATNLELREIVQMAHSKSRTAVLELLAPFREAAAGAAKAASSQYEQLDGDL